jgi:hypothetical protein
MRLIVNGCLGNFEHLVHNSKNINVVTFEHTMMRESFLLYSLWSNAITILLKKTAPNDKKMYTIVEMARNQLDFVKIA